MTMMTGCGRRWSEESGDDGAWGGVVVRVVPRWKAGGRSKVQRQRLQTTELQLSWFRGQRSEVDTSEPIQLDSFSRSAHPDMTVTTPLLAPLLMIHRLLLRKSWLHIRQQKESSNDAPR